MGGEFRVQNYRLKKKIAEASLAVCILDQLSKYNLTVNADKSEKYEIPRPPAPTPLTKMDVLIQQKNKKILWSELDWLVNYTPPPIESKEPDWRKWKLLWSLLGKGRHPKKENAHNWLYENYEDIYKSKRISISLKVSNVDGILC